MGALELPEQTAVSSFHPWLHFWVLPGWARDCPGDATLASLTQRPLGMKGKATERADHEALGVLLLPLTPPVTASQAGHGLAFMEVAPGDDRGSPRATEAVPLPRARGEAGRRRPPRIREAADKDGGAGSGVQSVGVGGRRPRDPAGGDILAEGGDSPTEAEARRGWGGAGRHEPARPFAVP